MVAIKVLTQAHVLTPKPQSTPSVCSIIPQHHMVFQTLYTQQYSKKFNNSNQLLIDN